MEIPLKFCKKSSTAHSSLVWMLMHSVSRMDVDVKLAACWCQVAGDTSHCAPLKSVQLGTFGIPPTTFLSLLTLMHFVPHTHTLQIRQFFFPIGLTVHCVPDTFAPVERGVFGTPRGHSD